MEIEKLIDLWKQFYQVHFNVELPEIKIPPRPEVSVSLVVVGAVPMLTIAKLARKVRHHTGEKFHSDPDWSTVMHDRDAMRDGAYAVWMNCGPDPDWEHRGRTPRWYRENAIKGCTIQEYCLAGFFGIGEGTLPYWYKAGGLIETSAWGLDVGWNRSCTTICTGSYTSDGSVVHYSAMYDPGEFADFDLRKPDDATAYFDYGTTAVRVVHQ